MLTEVDKTSLILDVRCFYKIGFDHIHVQYYAITLTNKNISECFKPYRHSCNDKLDINSS